MERSEFSKGITTFFLLIIISAGLVLLDSGGVILKPRAALTNLILPIQGVFVRAGQSVGNIFGFLTFWKSGVYKINYLDQRVRELTVEAEKVRNLEAENKALKEQLGIPFSKQKKLLMADVVGYSQNLLINKGAKDGVKEGMVVIYKDIYLGKAAKVLDNSAAIMVASDPISKVTAITSKTRTRGIVVGQFGVGASMEKVLSEEALEKEDAVLTTGEDGVQGGLLIGKIAEVKKEEAGVFQTAKLLLFGDYGKLREVFILMGD